MEFLQRAKDFLKGHKPLPRPEDEENKFLGGFNHLSQKQIRKIVTIVINEANKSRGFGLYIPPELLEREEGYFLMVFNTLGGVEQMVKNVDFEKAVELVGKDFHEMFSEISRTYHEYFSVTEPKSVLNRYDAHLSSLYAEVLQAAYHGQINL